MAIIPIGEFNLIQQTQYTPTTPKYNFPHTPLADQTLPQRFIELSIQTLKNTQNQSPTLYQPYSDAEPAQTETTEEITPLFLGQTSLQPKPIKLKPDHKPTTIVAVDVSSISLGETDAGTLIAIRGAIVWKNKAQYRYLRIGPFPFHITEENKSQVYRLFRQYSFLHQTPNDHYANSAPSLNHIAARMGSLLERWLQTITATTSHNSLILWDGSLTAGTPDAPLQIVSQLLETARNHLNTVLAFTKLTRLRLNGHRISDLTTSACTPPYLLPIDGYPMATSPHSTIRFLGNIHVAKLSEGNCSFRLDIDQKIPQTQAMEAAQRLVGNDLLLEGYPETLRLAHIYSTFTANEVLAVQRLLAQTHRLRIIQRPNIRRLLFGPFGKGPEC